MLLIGKTTGILFVAHLLLAAPHEDMKYTQAPPRLRRSGGYPKFPFTSPVPVISCGTREVEHHPHRNGAPYPKIVGGTETSYGAYPWQVEIEILKYGAKSYEHHCGGAIISERLIVTAAHCLQSYDPERLRVTVGKHRRSQHNKYEQVFRVDKILLHPKFRRDGYYSHDIGLLKLKATDDKGISYNSHVRPICLPAAHTRNAAGTWCTVTGWGAQKPQDMESLSDVLLAAYVPLLEQETCRTKEVYGDRDQAILDGMLCAGLLEGGVDACGGDSGGPLACEVDGRFVLTGLVSWGDGCAKPSKPGVYTRISHYVDWIHASFKKLGLQQEL
ncbi:mast cell tryptase-like [Schistocerca piceifrons]|uniref:mast cell tryptase-like n=1 Tax=Schistocerca piceifrons TaxID=274613 RepID=UPI001F5F0E4B|nr:mast cell tryptase-like [Schistocerca piceifrons]XP_049947184.1 mast cell tryptase-like [Schistocerca serialis cubense]